MQIKTGCKNKYKSVILTVKLFVKEDWHGQKFNQNTQALLIIAAMLYNFILLLEFWYSGFHVWILLCALNVLFLHKILSLLINYFFFWTFNYFCNGCSLLCCQCPGFSHTVLCISHLLKVFSQCSQINSKIIYELLISALYL